MKLVLGEHGSRANGKDVQVLVKALLGG